MASVRLGGIGRGKGEASWLGSANDHGHPFDGPVGASLHDLGAPSDGIQKTSEIMIMNKHLLLQNS